MKRFRDSNWQTAHSISADVNYMMAEHIGASQGITQAEIAAIAPRVKSVAEELAHKRGDMEWRDLPYSQAEIVAELKAFADSTRGKFRDFVVLGIGGSALGPMAVHQALNHPFYNELSEDKRGGLPRFYVLDNVDPERFAALLDIIEPRKTLFNVVTKSGSTSETMAQFMIIRAMLQETLGEGYANHIVATTDAEQGNLISIAKQEGYRVFYVPRGVGGRFSELCPVGLLPAALTGIDIEELLAGAAYMDQWISGHPDSNPAYLLGTLQYLAWQKGKNISVMMPYADSLKYVADWYAQLWAESLGKRFDLQGREVWVGQTPVRALGVTDQHSQVQLYTEGPFDKVITFLAVGEFRRQVQIPEVFSNLPGVAFLGGKSLNLLMEAERKATEFALLKAQRLSNTIFLPEVNAFTVGQLLYMLEVETAFVGELLNINAFDQPGVEEGKNATYALMGRPGFETKKEDLQAGYQKSAAHILRCGEA